jgi:hexosaminidase
MMIIHAEDLVPKIDIIPLPEKLEPRTGKFKFTEELRILTDVPNLWNADYLQNLLATPTGFHIEIQHGTHIQNNCIHLVINPHLVKLGQEGYRLEVLPDTILIESMGVAGVLYGIQTFRQLLPVEIEQRNLVLGKDWWVPGVLIEDKPRFQWRGFMLDEGRYFHGKEIVCKTLDLMVLQKLNIFHWHLTEDQGWRVEIKKYPKLT